MAPQGFFEHFDFGVEVFLFCFKLIGHWLILDATNKTHKNVQTQRFLDWFSFPARLDLWYLMWQAHTPSCIRMWRLACICIVCKCSVFTNEGCASVCGVGCLQDRVDSMTLPDRHAEALTVTEWSALKHSAFNLVSVLAERTCSMCGL